jgi:hypothetical protein
MSATMSATMPAPMSFRDVLRIDVMRRVWYAQIISLFGDWLALFAVIARGCCWRAKADIVAP